MQAVNLLTFSAPKPDFLLATKTLTQRVYDYVKEFFLFFPKLFLSPIVRFLVMPSSTWLYNLFIAKKVKEFSLQSYQLHFKTIEPFEVTTFDNVKIKGHFFQSNEPNAKVLIMFYGNGDFYQNEPFRGFSNDKFSFACFNPRGVAASAKGHSSKSNLLIDAEAIYQFLLKEKKIKEEKIWMYGHSLGGAQAALLKSLHPETKGKLILDRTFSTMKQEAQHFSTFLFPKPLETLGKKIALYAVEFFDWNYDTLSAIGAIQDPILVTNHEDDRVIPLSCSLSTGLTASSRSNIQITTTDFSYGECAAHNGSFFMFFEDAFFKFIKRE
jgi:alpha/beta hydrolase fold